MVMQLTYLFHPLLLQKVFVFPSHTIKDWVIGVKAVVNVAVQPVANKDPNTLKVTGI